MASFGQGVEGTRFRGHCSPNRVPSKLSVCSIQATREARSHSCISRILICAMTRVAAGSSRRSCARFADVGWEAPRVPEEMVAASEFYFDTASQVSLDHWASGRVALIGDAGYAAGPGANGTGNTIVAAYVLAGELAAAAGTNYPQPQPLLQAGSLAPDRRAHCPRRDAHRN